MRVATLIAACCFLSGISLASAHEGHSIKGANGGQVAEDAGHHVEFTTKDGQVVLFLTDEADKPMASDNSSGRVIIQDGAKKSNVELKPVSPNAMSAKLENPLVPGAKLVVSIKMADGHDVKARFVVK